MHALNAPDRPGGRPGGSRPKSTSGPLRATLLAVVAVSLAAGSVRASEWTFWRGPAWNGTSDETGLVSSWSPAGENLDWKAEFIGRSTPVVVDGRVCAIGRYGKKQSIEQLERVACFDAVSGKVLWDDRYPVYHTTVPFNRAGWASLAADPETGYVYSHGAAGHLNAYAPDGTKAWSLFLPEWCGRASGYGGRTQTPLVWRDLLVLGFVSAGWGDQAPPRHRTFAFDKRTGELVWVSSPGEMPKDMNTQGGPVVADVRGRDLLISGNADGWVYALDMRDGALVWKFHLSKRGINVHPVVHDGVVYISHSEENVDTPDMGRIVAIDATGTGDVTATHEKSRVNQIQAGFPSPLYHDGKLYVVDNSANLRRYDAATGKQEWVYSLGTVGKASPVWADGKIYAGETNGRFHILKPGDDRAVSLDMDELHVDEGRYAELYGSPAVAYGRVFFAAESGLYALRDKSRPAVTPERTPVADRKAPGKGAPTAVQVVPAEVLTSPGGQVALRVRAVDANGREVQAPAGTWTLEGLAGKIEGGRFRPDGDTPFQTGAVRFEAGELTARARVRVIADLPWSQDFSSFAAGDTPEHWIGAGGKFKVAELDGDKVVVQPPRPRGLQRSFTWIGRPDFRDYTVQVDFRGTQEKRRRPDIGVMNAGYTLSLLGNAQKLQILSWAAELRMAREVPFEWDMDTWYTMRMRVDVEGGKARIRGKVWKRGEAEPEGWTLTAEDPYPVTAGSPGLIGYAPAPVYYDNLKIWVND